MVLSLRSGMRYRCWGHADWEEGERMSRGLMDDYFTSQLLMVRNKKLLLETAVKRTKKLKSGMYLFNCPLCGFVLVTESEVMAWTGGVFHLITRHARKFDEKKVRV